MVFKVVRQLPNEAELESAISEMFRRNEPSEHARRLPVDIQEHADRYEVVAELPGVKKSDLSITVEKGVVTIKGTRKSAEEGAVRLVYSEIPTGTFDRSFVLPRDVDASKLGAELTGGLLTLTLPKSEAALPREISVK